jgi:ATP-dependent Lhr-like helicase
VAITAGDDALLLAPTAGGKTEAAIFPVLSAMATQGWTGLSVLYVCPLRAPLNNLEPRLAAYASWLGRRAGLWHGDTGYAARRRLLLDRPDLLLTTPESLEAMLVSTRVTPRGHFADVRVIVVDEVHAFAGDDRGWHLLADLERIQRLADRPLQRIGLSATVGNPAQLLEWLQGSNAGSRPARVVDPSGESALPSSADVTLDYVGNLANAGKVISSLHHGEKRLVFCESRRKVEELAVDLRDRGVTTFVSHSSLSVDERRRAEQAFAEARDCVIVSTSTLELGIDVGDLDRVIQVDAPRTVASFLQRLGRTGRRPGTSRNALFLATDHDSLLLAAGLLHLWAQGWVEPIIAPRSPRHLVAQQLLALCLQEGRVGDATWPEWWQGLPMFDDTAPQIVRWLIDTGHLETDSGMLFIGPEAERRFGRRHFMELLSVFAANPEFTVLHGRAEIGSIDPMQLTCKVDGPRVITLAGRPWQVNHIDWKRHRCYVEPGEARVRMRWFSLPLPLSFEMCQARREVLLGANPPVRLTHRADDALADLRADRQGQVADDRSMVERRGGDVWGWTWAGARANATLAAALPTVVDPAASYANDALRVRADVAPGDLDHAVRSVGTNARSEPAVDDRALRGLKFTDVLPPELARATLAERAADPVGASALLAQPRRWQ